MKIERTKNATRNVAFGMALTFYQKLMPFIMRTLMIYFLGVQYLGLNSLFTSILQVLNLAELGVGSAMVYSMYKPIHEDDAKTICALLKLYRKYYRLIGLVIATFGLLLIPFLKYIIKDELPADINLYILYLLKLSGTVFSYWMFSYKNSLLSAHQRRDIVSKIVMVISTIQNVLQVFVLVVLKNYYMFIIVAVVLQLVANVVTAMVVDKMFPAYKPVGQLPASFVKSINKRIRGLITSRIGGIIINSADAIVVSAFLGLTVLTIYQNYFFIIVSISGFMGIIYDSIRAGIGNSIVVESKEKNFNDLLSFSLIISWVTGICACCFLGLFQPFMLIWMGEEFLLAYSAIICYVIYFYIYEINRTLNLYKDAAGIWYEDRWRPLITALTNLGLNLFLVQFIGIYGVLLSTVLSVILVGMPWLIHNLFTYLFSKNQMIIYIKAMFYYTLVVVIACAVNIYLCSLIEINPWADLIIHGVISLMISNLIFIVAFRKLSTFKSMMVLANKMTKGKIKFISSRAS